MPSSPIAASANAPSHSSPGDAAQAFGAVSAQTPPEAAWSAFGRMVFQSLPAEELGALLANALDPQAATDEQWGAAMQLCAPRSKEIMRAFWRESFDSAGTLQPRFGANRAVASARVLQVLQGLLAAPEKELEARLAVARERFAESFGQERWILAGLGRGDWLDFPDLDTQAAQQTARQALAGSPRPKAAQRRPVALASPEAAAAEAAMRALHAAREERRVCQRVAAEAAAFACEIVKALGPQSPDSAALWARAGVRAAMDAAHSQVAALKAVMEAAEPLGLLDRFDWRSMIASAIDSHKHRPGSELRSGQDFGAQGAWPLHGAATAGPACVQARLMFSAPPTASEWAQAIGKSAQAAERLNRLLPHGLPDVETRKKMLAMGSLKPLARAALEAAELRESVAQASPPAVAGDAIGQSARRRRL